MKTKFFRPSIVCSAFLVIATIVASVTLGLAEVETEPGPSRDIITQDGPQFMALNVSFNPDNQSISAWQLALTLPEHVEIVGIENSQHPAFTHSPPSYDPAAIGNHRVILAQLAATDFATDALPDATTRMTTLHLMIKENSPAFEPNLDIVIEEVIGIDAQGERFEPAIEFEVSKPE